MGRKVNEEDEEMRKERTKRNQRRRWWEVRKETSRELKRG